MSVTLSRMVRRDIRTGDPLPDVYPSLRQAGIRLRRSNLHLIAGQTGSMKTMFAMDLIEKLKVPTLYFSNDSDEMTVASRALAKRVQRPFETVSSEMRSNREWAGFQLESLFHVRWCFDPSPSLDDIDLEMEAFNELYGEYPHLVVIDILDNVSYYEDTDHGAAARKLQFFHASARSSGAAFLVLHHCTEAVDGHPCPPRSAILQKQNKLPVLELTVATHDKSFFISPVKNRHGRSDPSGRTFVRLNVNPETCTFWEG